MQLPPFVHLEREREITAGLRPASVVPHYPLLSRQHLGELD